MIKVLIGPFEATLENGVWTCEREQTGRVLNMMTHMRPYTGYEPREEMAIARYIVEKFKGEIIYDSDGEPDDEPSQPGVYY